MYTFTYLTRSHLHLLVPTLEEPANQGSRMKMHLKVSHLLIPLNRAGLSLSLRPFLNQWTLCFLRETLRPSLFISRADFLHFYHCLMLKLFISCVSPMWSPELVMEPSRSAPMLLCKFQLLLSASKGSTLTCTAERAELDCSHQHRISPPSLLVGLITSSASHWSNLCLRVTRTIRASHCSEHENLSTGAVRSW